MPAFCHRCGEEYPPHARLCGRCGVTLHVTPKRLPVSMRERWKRLTVQLRSSLNEYIETSQYTTARGQRWKSQLDFGGSAGLWDRLMAYFLDMLICLALFFFTHKGLMPLGERIGFTPLEWLFFLTYALPLLYYSLMESSRLQATVGKLVFGMIVTTEGGVRISLTRAVLRNIIKLAESAFPVIFAVVLMNRKCQALHDIFLSTTVMSK